MSGSGYFARLQALAGGGAAPRPAPRDRARPVEPLEQEEVRVAPPAGSPATERPPAPADTPSLGGRATLPVRSPSRLAAEGAPEDVATEPRPHPDSPPASSPPAVPPPPSTTAEGPPAPRPPAPQGDRPAASPRPEEPRGAAPGLPAQASATPPPSVAETPDAPTRAHAPELDPGPGGRGAEPATGELSGAAQPGPARPEPASAPPRADEAPRRLPPPGEGFHEALVRVRRWMAEPGAEAETGEPPAPAPDLPSSPAPEPRGELRRVTEGRALAREAEPAAPVEQRTEVSIGTIHVTVEEPDDAVRRPEGRPAPAAAPARPRAIPRHYVRGW